MGIIKSFKTFLFNLGGLHDVKLRGQCQWFLLLKSIFKKTKLKKKLCCGEWDLCNLLERKCVCFLLFNNAEASLGICAGAVYDWSFIVSGDTRRATLVLHSVPAGGCGCGPNKVCYSPLCSVFKRWIYKV